ncbi:hypothetical protein [Mobiluncus curtisii]|uniref:hypothetical protein n=1 Tax=Mobiluncus curtisii TaxID=2051 RepID=UPI0014700ABF|nr:hypothetical protein [Mobiluncus curtisii]NMW43186.1 hypothetical protein [Mobiluncus curtisii]NMW46123.1 hypothetical protein [Mobiluncus curtisii]NMW82869.1 hypothetical protein [Mobiluncus curtisii]NMW99773.1 hypothetical protein [Mobiluncus curtisii]NMX04699.1 hypothetical protein [Mobiluncus curtisii]
MDEGEEEIRLVLQHMHQQKVITDQEFKDMNTLIDEDGTFCAIAGISAVVQNDPNGIPSELLDEILALEPVFDEGYYEEMLDALADRTAMP